MPMLSSFVSGFQKCYLFLRTTIRNVKNCISKNDVIYFTCFFFFTTAQPNIKILLWNLLCVLSVCRFTTHIPFFGISVKFWILKALIFEKSQFWIWGVNRRISKIRDIQIVAHSISRLLAFTGCVLLQTCKF